MLLGLLVTLVLAAPAAGAGRLRGMSAAAGRADRVEHPVGRPTRVLRRLR